VERLYALYFSVPVAVAEEEEGSSEERHITFVSGLKLWLKTPVRKYDPQTQ